MIARFTLIVLFTCCAPLTFLCAATTPPLLARALEHWTAGHDDLAFTQRTRVLLDDGQTKQERVERYDPSLPDSQRWRLLELDGRMATAEERSRWETKKNGKPRKQALKPLGEYLDLEHATLARETPETARFEVSFRPEAARLIDVEKIAVFITVEKESSAIAHISATLREPLKVALGLVKISDVDLDIGIDTPEDASPLNTGEVQTGSTARVRMSKLGNPMEFKWSDFKRVKSYPRPSAGDVRANPASALADDATAGAPP